LESNPPQKQASNPPSAGGSIRPGLESRVELRVGAGELASSIGNPGATVLATPILIGLLENASATAVRPYLPTGKLTVGTRVNVQHLAATPPGFTVVARSRLREVEGRKLLFDVDAHDGVEKVAEGTHERMIVDEARFLDRAAKKRKMGERQEDWE